MRLVSMTKWGWPKPEVEYDRNQGTLHVWTRPNMTMTNVHLLNMTENDYFFGQVQGIHVRRCLEFGHVHRFWSNSFGHLHLIMLTFLIWSKILQTLKTSILTSVWSRQHPNTGWNKQHLTLAGITLTAPGVSNSGCLHGQYSSGGCANQGQSQTYRNIPRCFFSFVPPKASVSKQQQSSFHLPGQGDQWHWKTLCPFVRAGHFKQSIGENI